MNADLGTVINGGMGGGAVVYRVKDLFEPFFGRSDFAVSENVAGEVRTCNVRPSRWGWLFEKHTRGKQRIALFPTVAGRCRFGVLDLDAHSPATPDRHADATSLLDFLDRRGIVAYMATSRGGRGVHLWFFFDPPGVLARHLHAFLEALAYELRAHGPVDVFPNAANGKGGAVLLPYFGGVVDLLNVDLEPVPRDKLEANAVSLIPTADVPTWPPATWRLYRASGNATVFAELVRELQAKGLVFQRGSALQARRGARNAIAGAVARDLVRHRATFRDFQEWDQGNVPPLANDEPEALARWWRWAKGKQQPCRRMSAANAQRRGHEKAREAG